jgi:drug/metabolite transporter (DMT)-like permease
MPDSPIQRGAMLAIGASFMFAAMGVGIRLASAHLSNEMVVFLRNVFGLLFLSPWIYRQGFGSLATGRLTMHVTRSFSGLAAMYCFFYAIAHLSLAEAVLLNYSAPLFIAPIALFWLREAIGPTVAAAILTGFIGIALVLKPGFETFSLAAWVGALSGFLAALAMVSVRRLSVTEPTVRIVFYFGVTCTVISTIPLFWAWQAPRWQDLAVMAVAGFFATQGQLLLTKGYSLAPAAHIGPYTYSSVIFAALFGWLFWQEIPDRFTLLGALLISVSGALAMTRKKTPAILAD